MILPFRPFYPRPQRADCQPTGSRNAADALRSVRRGAHQARHRRSSDSHGYQGFIDYIDGGRPPRLPAASSWWSTTSPARARSRPRMTLLAYLAAQDPAHPPRHRRGGAALAQPGAGRRAGRDARPALRRALRLRRRQGLPPGRVRRLLHPDRGGHRALRRGDGGHPQGLDQRGPLQPPRQALALRQHRGRAGAAAAARTRRSGSRPAAPRASGARRARATTCCSTSSPRSSRSSSASPLPRGMRAHRPCLQPADGRPSPAPCR